MKKLLISVILAASLLISMISVSAKSSASPLLVDDADLLSASEEEELSLLLEKASDKYGIDIVILTTYSLNGDSATDHADDFYDHSGYGNDGVLLLISTEYSDVCISTSGYGIKAFTDAGCDLIIDSISADLGKGEFYTAFVTYTELCEDLMVRAHNGDPYKGPFNVFGSIIISVVIGFIIAFIVTAVMKGQLKTVRFNDSASAYIKSGSMKVTSARDTYLYSNVIRTPKQKSSGSSTHTSSSGRVHGGRSGKF